MLTNPEQLEKDFLRAMEKPEKNVIWGVFRNDRMIGLFSFLVLPEEQYMEMLADLSYDKTAYLEMTAYLKEHFSGYAADFVFNSKNHLLKEQLEAQVGAAQPPVFADLVVRLRWHSRLGMK